jgi:hypothetical protein
VKAPALAFFLVVAATPALALEPQAYHCVVIDSLDDSRYPPGEESIALNRAMAVVLVDLGDRIEVKTTRPGLRYDEQPVAGDRADGGHCRRRDRRG